MSIRTTQILTIGTACTNVFEEIPIEFHSSYKWRWAHCYMFVKVLDTFIDAPIEWYNRRTSLIRQINKIRNEQHNQ